MSTLLYHYTDGTALASIVEHTNLRATDFRYLNDRFELNYAWRKFVRRLVRLSEQAGSYNPAWHNQLDALDLMGARNLLDIDDPVFVACFSELGDDLSQWRGYGDHGRGFALGFDRDLIDPIQVPIWRHTTTGTHTKVRDALTGKHFTQPAYRRKVGYGARNRKQVVQGLLDAVEAICTEHSSEVNVGNLVFQFPALIDRVALAKNAVFKHEREHRICIREHVGGRSANERRALVALGEPFASMAAGTLDTVDVRFRTARSTGFKPYVELPLARESLKEVVVGPLNSFRRVEPSVRRLLDRYGFRDTIVCKSTVPFQE